MIVVPYESFCFFAFLSTAILSISSQTRLICREVSLSLNFQASFSFFFNGFFLCLSKKVKEALLISGIVLSRSFFLVPIAKKNDSTDF